MKIKLISLILIVGLVSCQKEFTHVFADPIKYEDYFINNTSKDVSIGCYSVDNGQLIEMVKVEAGTKAMLEKNRMYELGEDFDVFDVWSFSQRDRAVLIFSDGKRIECMNDPSSADRFFSSAETTEGRDTTKGKHNECFVEHKYVCDYTIAPEIYNMAE